MCYILKQKRPVVKNIRGATPEFAMLATDPIDGDVIGTTLRFPVLT